MSHNRRKFLSLTALSAGALTMSSSVFGKNTNNHPLEDELPKSIRDLMPAKEGIIPITIEERKQRIQNAQAMMDREKIDAIFLEGTTSCYYFTGMRWGHALQRRQDSVRHPC